MRARVDRLCVPLFLGVFACGGGAPSDDPADWEVEPGRAYTLEVSEPRLVVPSKALPANIRVQPSNNNVDIVFHEDRLFMAWRSSETHWASPETELHVVSSVDEGQTWDFELTLRIGADMREPRLLSIAGRLLLYYFEAGTSMVSFTPKFMWRAERRGLADWTEPETFGREGEVPWDLKLRGGVAYLTSYAGARYNLSESAVEVYFQRSTDGVHFEPVEPDHVVSYHGGVSEVAFEFTSAGDAWFVTRNEDGDQTGFGSHVCFARKASLARWECPERSDPERYDSPEMFRHGDELYLVARRDVGGPYDQGLELPVESARLRYQVDYWGRPKRTAIYRIDQEARRVEHRLDLPSAGDTAFPAIRRTGPHSFLLANYSSPFDRPDISWSEGQGSERGTQIYLFTLTFQPE